MSHPTPVVVIAADYYRGGKRRGNVLDIVRIEDGRRFPVSSHPVAGKAEARKLALSLGATPWNF